MNECACGCGAPVYGRWRIGHNRRGVPPINKKASALKDACGEGGYFWVYAPDHPRARKNGYVKRAVLVLEGWLGRSLRDGEDVHHKNGDKADDSSENLAVLTHAKHAETHSYLRHRTHGRFMKAEG